MTEAPYTFEQGEQVRIKPFKSWPSAKASGGIRYGIIVLRTRSPGMCFVDLDRASEEGEEAYCVGTWATRGASGASWISTAHLEKMKRGKRG